MSQGQEYQLEDMAEAVVLNKPERLIKKRLWMLTWNGDYEMGVGMVTNFVHAELDRHLRYCCYCKEVAPSTGHVHMHVLLSFNDSYPLSSIKNNFPGFHYDACKGTIEQVMKYVKKDGNFKELGNPPKTKSQAQKIRWEKVFDNIYDGKDYRSILMEQPNLALHVNKFDAIKRALRDFTPETFNGDLHSKCLWLCGAAGTYKSHSVRAVAIEMGLHIVDKDSHTSWFNGYDNMDKNSVILIDDLQPEHFKTMLGIIKNIADRYPQTQLPVKGGHAKMDGGARVVVTSNYSINEMLIKDTDHSNNEAGAIYRRFHEIIIPTGAKYTKLEDTMKPVRDWFRQYPFRDETINWFDQFLIPNWDRQLIYDIMGHHAGDKDAVLEEIFINYPEEIYDPALADVEELPIKFEKSDNEDEEPNEDSIADE